MQSKSLSKKAVMAKGALLAVLTPRLAADAKPGALSASLDTLLSGVGRKNWLEKKPGIIAALKPIMANDDDTIAQVIESLEQIDDENPNENPTDNDEVANDSPADAICEKLRGKIDDQTLAEVKSMIEGLAGAPAATDAEETPEEKKAKADALEKAKLAGDTPNPFPGKPADPYKNKDKDMVSKGAMDAAIKIAMRQATDGALKVARGIVEAEAAISPYVGKLALAFDSAESVYKAALEALKVEVKDLHPSAYKAVLEAQPRPGGVRIAYDASRAEPADFDKRFPNGNRLNAA